MPGPDAGIALPLPPESCGTPDERADAVDWMGGLSPAPETPPAYGVPPEALTVGVEVYEAGVTEPAGAPAGIEVELWTNARGACVAAPMVWRGASGPQDHNDRFEAALPLAGTAPGVYRYRARAGRAGAWSYSPEALLLIEPLRAIDALLDAHPPATTAASAPRERTLLDLDACLMSGHLTGPSGFLDVQAAEGRVRRFHLDRIARLATALAQPAARPEIWLVYNAGLVYRTPSVTVGIDVVLPGSDDPWSLPWATDSAPEAALASRLDVLLVTHGHSDHADRSLMAAVLAAGGAVVAPASLAAEVPGTTGLEGDGELQPAGVTVRAFTGPHAYDDALARTTDHRHYEIVPADGPLLLHTGDLDHTLGLCRSGAPVGVLAAKAGGVSPE